MTIGRVIGIARRSARFAPMEETGEAVISKERGLDGDHKGLKYRRRAITVLSREGWEAALGDIESDSNLPWTVRRANLYVEGVALPRARKGVLRVGEVVLEVTAPTLPCKRMEDAQPGLLKALYPDWRGGISCLVVKGGTVALHDEVEVLVSPAERRIRLPG